MNACAGCVRATCNCNNREQWIVRTAISVVGSCWSPEFYCITLEARERRSANENEWERNWNSKRSAWAWDDVVKMGIVRTIARKKKKKRRSMLMTRRSIRLAPEQYPFLFRNYFRFVFLTRTTTPAHHSWPVSTRCVFYYFVWLLATTTSSSSIDSKLQLLSFGWMTATTFGRGGGNDSLAHQAIDAETEAKERQNQFSRLPATTVNRIFFLIWMRSSRTRWMIAHFSGLSGCLRKMPDEYSMRTERLL